MKPIVFYFEFYNEQTGATLTRAFNITGIDDPTHDDSFDSFVCDMEDHHGVHDWSSAPHDRVVGIGYCTYETSPSEIDLVMEKWQSYFRQLGGNVSNVITVSLNNSMNDFDVYQETIK